MRATFLRVFEFFNDQRRRAFAHDEAIAHFIEWATRQRRIAGPAAHGFDQIKRAERESGEGRFGSAGDNDIRKIIADVTQSFADGDSAARATVRVRRADTAKTKLNRDVRMRRSAEDLQRQRRIHAVRAFFQKTNVLIFRLANSAERGAETHANARLRILRRVGEAGIVQRHFGRGDRELRVAIETFQPMRRKKIFRHPVTNFSGATCVKTARIKSRDRDDAAFLRADALPEIFAPASDTCNRSDPGDDRSPSAHWAATIFPCDSR